MKAQTNKRYDEAPKRLLVTGGAGFIGSNFTYFWLKNHPQDTVIVLDKLTYAGNAKTLDPLSRMYPRNFQFHQGNICNQIAINSAMMGGIDMIVHFAAETHVDRSLADSIPFIETNVNGTRCLLEAALRHKVKRFHLISTDEVFGALELTSTEKFNEQTRYDPRNPYAATKAAADHLVRAYYYTYGLPITITNCTNNYGPYQFPEKLIPLAITNIIEGKPIPVYGDGEHIRDWLYVEDHCRAIESVLLHGIAGETYCVGGMTKDISNVTIAEKIATLMGKDASVIEYVTDRPGHDRKYAMDWSKIHRELGWKPLFDFDRWLASTITWYRENEAWWRPLKNKR